MPTENSNQIEKLSPRAEHDLAEAKALLKKADAEELYALFERSQRSNAALANSLLQVSMHYAGSNSSPRYEPSPSAVEAMERVALAAIQLARDVALSEKKGE